MTDHPTIRIKFGPEPSMSYLAARLFARVLIWPVPQSDVADLMVEAGNAIKDQITAEDRLREALEQCAEYFDDRSDVDTRDGEPVANKEMRLLGVVREALGEK